MTQSQVLTRFQKRKLKNDTFKVASVRHDQITQQEQSFAMVRTLLLSAVSPTLSHTTGFLTCSLSQKVATISWLRSVNSITAMTLRRWLGTANSSQKTVIKSVVMQICRTMVDPFIIPFTTQPASYRMTTILEPARQPPTNHGLLECWPEVKLRVPINCWTGWYITATYRSYIRRTKHLSLECGHWRDFKRRPISSPVQYLHR